MQRIGLVINPIAGLGGTVGLKGTDGLSEEALKRGAEPRSLLRAEETLSLLQNEPIEFLTASGSMGEDALRNAGISRYTVLYECNASTTAEDTVAACRRYAEAGAALILFVGGDGTARDVLAAIGTRIPILGIPAGVKMYSAVFATDPQAAAPLIRDIGSLPLQDAEVLDVDEVAYRSGRLSTRLYGIARIPYRSGFLQHAKETYATHGDEERQRREIARFMAAVLSSGRPFILGAGSTTEAIADEMVLPKTLLGIDAYAGGTRFAGDLDARSLLAFLERHPDARLIISPIGSQGFIIGRGTQVITPAAISRIGVENIIVVATPEKLRGTPLLHIDTGDRLCDAAFPETIRVICGYGIAERRRLASSCSSPPGDRSI